MSETITTDTAAAKAIKAEIAAAERDTAKRMATILKGDDKGHLARLTLIGKASRNGQSLRKIAEHTALLRAQQANPTADAATVAMLAKDSTYTAGASKSLLGFYASADTLLRGFGIELPSAEEAAAAFRLVSKTGAVLTADDLAALGTDPTQFVTLAYAAVASAVAEEREAREVARAAKLAAEKAAELGAGDSETTDGSGHAVPSSVEGLLAVLTATLADLATHDLTDGERAQFEGIMGAYQPTAA